MCVTYVREVSQLLPPNQLTQVVNHVILGSRCMCLNLRWDTRCTYWAFLWFYTVTL